mgnify:CR=1 FL=1
MNNLIERIWKQGGMVNIEDLRGTAFQAEESAHTFRIRGVDVSGEPLALTGTVGAVFLRADNTDVAITGTITAGAAEVTLTAAIWPPQAPLRIIRLKSRHLPTERVSQPPSKAGTP